MSEKKLDSPHIRPNSTGGAGSGTTLRREPSQSEALLLDTQHIYQEQRRPHAPTANRTDSFNRSSGLSREIQGNDGHRSSAGEPFSILLEKQARNKERSQSKPANLSELWENLQHFAKNNVSRTLDDGSSRPGSSNEGVHFVNIDSNTTRPNAESRSRRAESSGSSSSSSRFSSRTNTIATATSTSKSDANSFGRGSSSRSIIGDDKRYGSGRSNRSNSGSEKDGGRTIQSDRHCRNDTSSGGGRSILKSGGADLDVEESSHTSFFQRRDLDLSLETHGGTHGQFLKG